jgi:hypothetical protein
VISRVAVSLTMLTGGVWRPFRHDRHFRDASSFQIGVPAADVLQRDAGLGLATPAFDLQPAEPSE